MVDVNSIMFPGASAPIQKDTPISYIGEYPVLYYFPIRSDLKVMLLQ
jgi:hypothetical protein